MEVKSYYNTERDKRINLKQTPQGLHLEIQSARQKGSIFIVLSKEEANELAKDLTLAAEK